jgi:hypothetical protein
VSTQDSRKGREKASRKSEGTCCVPPLKPPPTTKCHESIRNVRCPYKGKYCLQLFCFRYCYNFAHFSLLLLCFEGVFTRRCNLVFCTVRCLDRSGRAIGTRLSLKGRLDMRKVYGRCPERGHFPVVTEARYPESERTDGAFKLEKFPIIP